LILGLLDSPNESFYYRMEESKMSCRLSTLMFLVIGFLAMTPQRAVPQELLTQKVVSLDMAQAIAQGALSTCRAGGFHVSISVIDDGGTLKAFMRDDGAGLGSVEVSRRKAYTALIFRRTSAETAKIWASTTPVPIIPGTVALSGGVPIKAGNEVIGAIGISGAPDGDKEMVCANAGISRVADKLK
jgi:uncharacterized protein GlcG (DUF336 family)